MVLPTNPYSSSIPPTSSDSSSSSGKKEKRKSLKHAQEIIDRRGSQTPPPRLTEPARTIVPKQASLPIEAMNRTVQRHQAIAGGSTPAGLPKSPALPRDYSVLNVKSNSVECAIFADNFVEIEKFKQKIKEIKEPPPEASEAEKSLYKERIKGFTDYITKREAESLKFAISVIDNKDELGKLIKIPDNQSIIYHMLRYYERNFSKEPDKINALGKYLFNNFDHSDLVRVLRYSFQKLFKNPEYLNTPEEFLRETQSVFPLLLGMIQTRYVGLLLGNEVDAFIRSKIDGKKPLDNDKILSISEKFVKKIEKILSKKSLPEPIHILYIALLEEYKTKFPKLEDGPNRLVAILFLQTINPAITIGSKHNGLGEYTYTQERVNAVPIARCLQSIVNNEVPKFPLDSSLKKLTGKEQTRVFSESERKKYLHYLESMQRTVQLIAKHLTRAQKP